MKIDYEMKYMECHIFPDTECFLCGLCDMARQEKEYAKEYYSLYVDEMEKCYNEGTYE